METDDDFSDRNRLKFLNLGENDVGDFKVGDLKLVMILGCW